MRAVSVLQRVFSFPLLAKELTEAAARRRTYVMRVIYGALLFVTIALWMPRVNWSGSEDFVHMGMGLEIFGKLLALQFIGLALFLPALMAGSITHEKERDSLVLLLLTELRPWSIVLQKYVGGLVPVLSFLLLAMPCMAIAYAFGGISAEDVLWSSIALLLTALQIGALSLMLSVWCRTTVGAFIGTYFWTVALYATPPFLVAMWAHMDRNRNIDDKFALILVPGHILEYGIDRASRGQDTGYLLLHAGVDAASALIFLALARLFLVRRAFLPASSIFLRLFKVLDRLMKWANRFVGGYVIVRDPASLPEDEPIVWREITRKAMGKAVYLFRILMAVEIPVILICTISWFTFDDSRSQQCEGLSILAAVVGALGVLALGAQAANTIVSERIQQTLEVLLTTPLGAAEIVKQKAKALRRIMLILAIPLLTIFGTECWIEHSFTNEWRTGVTCSETGIMYALCAVLSLSIFLPLVSWLALWIGLKMRTRFKAIVAALAAIVAWCALPLVAAGFVYDHWRDRAWIHEGTGAISLLSPLSIVYASEQGTLHEFFNLPTWFVVAATFSFYALLLWLIRRQALRNADFYLRR